MLLLSDGDCCVTSRDGMSRAEAEELVKTALALAMSRCCFPNSLLPCP